MFDKILLTLVACAPVVLSAAFPPVLHGLGYRITGVSHDEFGVDIAFDTTNPPPYLVGVFVAEEYGFERARISPVRTKLVWDKVASLSGRFRSRGNTFAQVFDASVTNQSGLFHVMTEDEATRYFDNLREREARRTGIVAEAAVDIWNDYVRRSTMRLVKDFTWGSFVATNAAYLTLSMSGRMAVPDLPVECSTNQVIVSDDNMPFATNHVLSVVYDDSSSRPTKDAPFILYGWMGRKRWHKVTVRKWNENKGAYEDFTKYIFYNPHYPHDVGSIPYRYEYVDRGSVTAGPLDPFIGSGIRVLYDERTGEVTAERAHSIYGDRSDEIVLRRAFKPMSSDGLRKVMNDWLGFRMFAPETNAVPGRIYWEGL